jgi:hypothetical protein
VPPFSEKQAHGFLGGILEAYLRRKKKNFPEIEHSHNANWLFSVQAHQAEPVRRI